MSAYLLSVEGVAVALARSAEGLEDMRRYLLADGVLEEHISTVEITHAMRRFSPNGRAAIILTSLSIIGPARSVHALKAIDSHPSNRYHYQAMYRLSREGLVKIDWNPAGRSTNVAITPRGEALLAYWDWTGQS